MTMANKSRNQLAPGTLTTSAVKLAMESVLSDHFNNLFVGPVNYFPNPRKIEDSIKVNPHFGAEFYGVSVPDGEIIRGRVCCTLESDSRPPVIEFVASKIQPQTRYVC
jgi:hypothetical protein